MAAKLLMIACIAFMLAKSLDASVSMEYCSISCRDGEILGASTEPSTITGWRRMSNRRWYKLFTTKASYQQAKQTCEGNQAHLAAEGMRNPGIRREIMDSFDFTSHTWIGLDDIATEGTFMWIDNVISTSTNTEWTARQPDDWKNSEDCVGIVGGREDLNDYECSEPAFYLCETEAIM